MKVGIGINGEGCRSHRPNAPIGIERIECLEVDDLVYGKGNLFAGPGDKHIAINEVRA